MAAQVIEYSSPGQEPVRSRDAAMSLGLGIVSILAAEIWFNLSHLISVAAALFGPSNWLVHSLVVIDFVQSVFLAWPLLVMVASTMGIISGMSAWRRRKSRVGLIGTALCGTSILLWLMSILFFV